MKAIRLHTFGEPEVMQLEEAPDPQPGPGQVVVRVHAVGVNPVETYIRSGIYPKPPTPYTPGNDGAGVIAAVGPDVTQWTVGQRVYIAGALSGTYAERCLCAANRVHSLPECASFAQGAAINVPYGTAYHALFQRAHGTAGESVLVHGASGGVGIAAVQLAWAAGMTVIGTAGTERGKQLVREQGAQHVLDHTAAGYLDEVMRLTGGRGVDVILEMLANVNLGNDLAVLARGGRVAAIGNRGPGNQGTVTVNPRAAMSRDASILGISLGNASERELVSMHAALVAGLATGALKPVIGQTFPLAEAAKAHHAVIESRAYGKIVLTP
ncbi:MAG: NADPH:quinone reductase [Candidatus Tectomicrobia bacterium]|uniref:NADPH:quinone reductase n=1 Tax=Tectimicrobiota bacterium TaxID=2528274 RepID=A0A937VWP9_UNCTE|nr:NADPH:quinone reductase [Candidatus Tectomicrobia bacterium]